MNAFEPDRVENQPVSESEFRAFLRGEELASLAAPSRLDTCEELFRLDSALNPGEDADRIWLLIGESDRDFYLNRIEPADGFSGYFRIGEARDGTGEYLIRIPDGAAILSGGPADIPLEELLSRALTATQTALFLETRVASRELCREITDELEQRITTPSSERIGYLEMDEVKGGSLVLFALYGSRSLESAPPHTGTLIVSALEDLIVDRSKLLAYVEHLYRLEPLVPGGISNGEQLLSAAESSEILASGASALSSERLHVLATSPGDLISLASIVPFRGSQHWEDLSVGRLDDEAFNQGTTPASRDSEIGERAKRFIERFRREQD